MAELKGYLIEKVRGIDRRQMFILLLLFLLAFGVRAHLMNYEWLFGFDSYWHARITGYVVQDGVPPERDPLAYYQINGAPLGSPGPVFWQFSAFAYKVFTLGAPYNKELWLLFVRALPALYGAMICIAMFFLLKTMYNEKAGYAAAFFAALVPSFVYRTMAGFFEEDSLGFLWMIIGLYFFVKAVKNPKLDTEHYKNMLLSGIFFGILAWTWGMFLMVPLILMAYFFLMLVLMWFRSEDSAVVKSFVVLFVVVFATSAALASFEDGGAWVNSMTGYVTQYIPVTPENIERAQSKGEGVLQQTIGEENTGRQFWGIKYNALIVFPFIALGLIAYRMLRNPKDRVSLIIFFWIVLALFMAWNKLKFTYVLGLPIAASAGVVFGEVFYFMRGRESFEKKFVGIALAFMLLVGLGAGTFFVMQKFPNIHLDNGWLPALDWARESLPPGSKFFNWWDQGHWISFISGMAVSVDNRNYDYDADRNFAKFVLAESEAEAYAIVKGYGSEYVMFDIQTLMKMGSLGMYAYNTTNTSDPRLLRYFAVVIPCSVEATTEGTIHHCGGNSFKHNEMLAMPDKWIAQPNHLEQERVPMFVYRTTEATHMVALNSAANETMAAKLWFSHPELEHFEVAYSHPQVKIFKVK